LTNRFLARETLDQADIATVLTFDEARRIAVNVAKLTELSEGNGTPAYNEQVLSKPPRIRKLNDRS